MKILLRPLEGFVGMGEKTLVYLSARDPDWSIWGFCEFVWIACSKDKSCTVLRTTGKR